MMNAINNFAPMRMLPTQTRDIQKNSPADAPKNMKPLFLLPAIYNWNVNPTNSLKTRKNSSFEFRVGKEDETYDKLMP